ncbi:MAG: class I SAM-dependent methyltransferase [Chloroflexi bacterium]|nr:class I SAM-dependent methyltransferase [Chloroflexota bacterium]
MTSAFQADYANYYDLLYKDKDYEAECDFLEQIFERFCNRRPRTVLDVGCGTGGHAIPLARRGYEVTGIDVSEAMIAIARQKAEREGLSITFHVTKMENLELDQRFDVVISMFNAINYVISDEGLREIFTNIHRHLTSDGLFLFDFRNGITSLRSYSPLRIKWAEDGRLRLLRISETKLDAMEHLFYTTYKCLVFEGDRLVKEFQDEHIVRYLFPREVKHFLSETGFELLWMCPFLELDKPASEEDWNIMVIARK